MNENKDKMKNKYINKKIKFQQMKQMDYFANNIN